MYDGIIHFSVVSESGRCTLKQEMRDLEEQANEVDQAAAASSVPTCEPEVAHKYLKFLDQEILIYYTQTMSASDASFDTSPDVPGRCWK